MTRRVWDSIGEITDEQFLAEDESSCDSSRELMVHLAHTDRNWLNGLKNLPDLRGELQKYDENRDRESVRTYWDAVAKDVTNYVSHLSQDEVDALPNDIQAPFWQVLLHLVNHGTDHRSTVLQKLTRLGVATFGHDFIIWL